MIKSKILFLVSVILITSLCAVTLAHADECTYPTQNDLSAVVKVFTGAGASGTGTYVNEHQLVTSAHILPENSTRMVASTSDGSHLFIRTLDPYLDVAIFDVYPAYTKGKGHPAGITPIKMNSQVMESGEDLYVAGYVRDQENLTVSKGYTLVAHGPRLYMSAPVVGGQSGGPVLSCIDGELQLVGIVKGYLGVDMGTHYERFNNATTAVPTEFINISFDLYNDHE